jgi:hypothetical protein
VNAPAENSSAWFRQLWPWLLMLPPLTAVAGGIMMIWLATHTPAPLVVDDYARIEELTAARFAKDEIAAINRIAASANFDRSGPFTTHVAVGLLADPPAVAPDFLYLHFRHATEAELDRTVAARRDGTLYRAEIDLGDGTYLVEIEPPEKTWRLAARLRETDQVIELRAGEPAR